MKRNLFPLLMLLPSILFMMGIVIYPTIFVIELAFSRWELASAQSEKVFVGVDNFIRLANDSRFWWATARTLQFTVLSVLLSFGIGFGLALLLDRVTKGRSLFSTALLVPMVMAPTIIGLGSRFMLNYDVGIVNYFLEVLGFGKQPFLGDPSLALAAVALTDVWQWTPFMVLVLLAGLESLPQECFEAAHIDGASSWRVFLHITLPLMRPVILVAVLFRTMDALKEFDKIYLMTQGGPGISSETLSLYVWKTGFYYFHVGDAAAMGFVYLYLSIFVCIVIIRMTRR